MVHARDGVVNGVDPFDLACRERAVERVARREDGFDLVERVRAGEARAVGEGAWAEGLQACAEFLRRGAEVGDDASAFAPGAFDQFGRTRGGGSSPAEGDDAARVIQRRGEGTRLGFAEGGFPVAGPRFRDGIAVQEGGGGVVEVEKGTALVGGERPAKGGFS